MSDDYNVENGGPLTSDNAEHSVHCSPDESNVFSNRGADSFSPPADAVHPNVEPPPAPPALLYGGETPEGCYSEVWGGKPEKKQGSAASKAVILTLCVLVLIAASAMVFMGTDNGVGTGAGLGYFSGDPAEDADDGTDTSEYQTYEDFFNAYYADSVTGVSGLETVAAEEGMTLEINSPSPNGVLDLTEIYQKCAPSVVGIKAGVSSVSEYWGTGIIFGEDGYIVTNYHIIDGAQVAAVVTYDETEYEAKLVGYDSDSDLAVLKIDATGLTPAQFGDSSALQVGEAVAAIGNPLGEQFRGTLTDGIISAIDRSVEYEGHTMTLLQTNAAINEGNSGGPLINMYGQVVGITNMKMVSYCSNIEGIGFAIPSQSVKTIVDELLARGYVTGRPALGVTVGAMPAGVAEEYDIPEGLYISGVEEGSDAWAQGVRVGDILTHVNGQEVTTTDEVAAIKDGFQVGDSLTLTIYRDGSTFDVEVMLQEKGELFG